MTADGTGAHAPSVTSRPWSRFSVRTLLLLVAVSALLSALWVLLTASPPVQVAGEVTYQGQPIGAGVIVFQSSGPSGLKFSTNIVNGQYLVQPGMVAGSYAVSVQDNQKALPANYTSPTASGLTVEVRDAMVNTINFDLR